jgi:glycosyltransferase involved in cell wall biosynthesis
MLGKKRLLVYSYFCPDSHHRPGGVQQIVEPLLTALEDLYGWTVEVAHPEPCSALRVHHVVLSPAASNQPEAVDPEILAGSAWQFRQLERHFDVVLSVDRVLPVRPSRPSVLMSNTLCYQPEVWAVMSNSWDCIVAPTQHYATRVESLHPSSRIRVVPYGLPSSSVDAIISMRATAPEVPAVVRAPHRPDPRKGQVLAIEGLAKGLPDSRETTLEVSWLDERRFSGFRRYLERLAAARGVAAQVVIVPWDNGPQRWRALERASITLQLGTFEESFGLTVIETVLSGRTVITGHQPAIREVLHGNPLHIELDAPVNWYRHWDRCRDRSDKAHLQRDLGLLAESLSLTRMAAAYDHILTETASQ